MVKQLSSLDINFLLKELMELKGSRVNKVYNSGKEEISIEFYKTNVGKKILRIINGKSAFLTQNKFADETPSQFCMLLRKHLEGKFLDSLVQLEPERIIKFVFKTKEDVKKIYIEFFGKGNIILCNNDEIIINPLIHHKFKDRSIMPKEEYKYPDMKYNIFDLNKKDIENLLKNSKKG